MEVSECFTGSGYYGAGGSEYSPERKGMEQSAVEDLLDFSNEDVMASGEGFLENVAANSANSLTVTAVDSCNSSLSGGNNQFSGELCVPYDDLAELEWLSNFVEDSFSTKHNLQQPLRVINGPNSKPTTPESSSSDVHGLPRQNAKAVHRHPVFLPETLPPSKSRSKLSRAAPRDWTTSLVHLDHAGEATKPPKTSAHRRQRGGPGLAEPRKCLHCSSEKTPQWRTGPMGPKTLCNACGVRHKSGRLVPEYRPAASPTFVPTKHSNSHRKVLELRRQKSVGQGPIFARSKGLEGCMTGHSGDGPREHCLS